MGQFSFLTGDTKESILVSEPRKVYLLQPNKEASIEEDFYGGYGDFGAVDAYEWLATRNVKPEIIERAKKIGIPLRDLGITINTNYYIDTRTGIKYSNCYNELFPELKKFNYTDEFDGETVNGLIFEDVWEKVSFEKLLGEIKFPLKFSFDKDAVYEELEGSKDCPNQGWEE